LSSQLYQLLTALSSRQRQRFLLFVQSPYYNQRSELSSLAQMLITSLPKLPQKELAYRQLFPTRSYRDSHWRLLQSDLLQLLESFLGVAYQDAFTSTEQQLRLLITHRELRQPKRYSAAQRRVERMVPTLPHGIRRARLDYEIASVHIDSLYSNRELSLDYINSLQGYLNRAYVLESIKLAAIGLSMRTITPNERQSLITEVEELIIPDKLIDDIPLALHYYGFQLLTKPENAEAFSHFKRLQPHLRELATSEARDLLMIAVNYCIRRVNAGEDSAGEAALDLYAFGLENEFLLDNGRLPRITFSNVVALALKAGADERARDFIDRFTALLPAQYRQSTEALNRARLAYAGNQLSASMEYLRSARDQDVLTTLNIKILQMRVYHQLGEMRLLDAHLDALDIYLRRRKDSLDYHYKAYRELVSFVRKYRRLNHYDLARMELFKKEVLASKVLPERDWLIGILDEKVQNKKLR